MRAVTFRLIDIGFDEHFTTSMAFAQSIIGAYNVGWGENPAVEVEYVRTRLVDGG